MLKNNKKKSNPLAQQNVVYRARKKNTLFAKKNIYLVLFLSFILTLFFVEIPNKVDFKIQNKISLNAEWEVNFETQVGHFLSSTKRTQILSKIKETLKQKKEITLQELVKAIHQSSNFSKVQVLQPHPQKILIKVWQREANLAIEADTLRMISTKHEVYGKCLDNKCFHLPVLSGVFAEDKIFKKTENNSFMLSKKEIKIIKSAKDLIDEMKKNKIHPTNIIFEAYRGFQALISPQPIHVTIGMKPFKTKIKRLAEILTQTKDKSMNIEQIELDYSGKAFIKEKTQPL
tara:strand:- start:195 stop:1058 length:864 start_codon:yes stop_codon:yes gene_type:complete